MIERCQHNRNLPWICEACEEGQVEADGAITDERDQLRRIIQETKGLSLSDFVKIPGPVRVAIFGADLLIRKNDGYL